MSAPAKAMFKPLSNMALHSQLDELFHLHRVNAAAFDAGDYQDSVEFINCLIESKLSDLITRYAVLAEQEDQQFKDSMLKSGLSVVEEVVL